MGEKLDHLRTLLNRIVDLGGAAGLLGWDQQTYMPPGGAQSRAYQLATLNTLAHELFVNDDFGEALEAVGPEVADLDPDGDEARLVKFLNREFDKQRKVPSQWVAEFNQVTSLAQQTWQSARKDADFSPFAPHLEKIVVLRRQYVDFFAPYDHIYDPLLDDFEPGMKTAEVIEVFNQLRPKQVELVKSIVEEGTPVDDGFMYEHYDEQPQWDFGMELIKAIGFDLERGRQDKSAHPFTSGSSIDDVRITTRIKPRLLYSSMLSSLHEAGHAMYAQGVSPTLERTPLTNGASLAVHESQSRLWENLVGRSRPFWNTFYPRLRELFPNQLGSLDAEAFYRGINKVQPSFIRVEADEATYNLHVMLRFDLEIALMLGEIEIADLPEAWNTKMQEYLGITPPDDAEGVLQDIHWSAGLMGYFPTYSLGNLMASQFWGKIVADLPDLQEQIGRREFGDLLAWLREHIHQHGGKFEPMELLQRVTGSGLTPEPYLDYLSSKYSDIYGL